jgi:GlcNAc-P-P-Und epimerase
MINCVIFGGNGFIGNHFSHFLINSGIVERVFLFDLKPTLSEELGNAAVELICGDVRKRIDIESFPKDISLIVNFAATHREPGHEDYEYFETNILGNGKSRLLR